LPDHPAVAVPPIATTDLPGTGGTIGPEPEDFQVDEIPLYAPSGEGEHLYVRVQKRRMTTREAVSSLARAAGVPQSEIGTAGMKDKHAVTTQWMSLPARRAKPLEAWTLPEGLSVVESSRHGNKLRTGHLRGNRFRIRLVEVEQGAIDKAASIVGRLREQGLPNYFGAQRFGRDGDNLATALAWIERDARGEGGRTPPFERKLFASVLQSEVFNRYVTARLELALGEPLVGEVVRLEGTGSLFAVDDPAREMSRWKSNDIHPTGPMIGPKMRKAHGKALALEDAAVESVGLTGETLARLGKLADGTRRDLLLLPEDLRVEAENEGRALVVEVTLPAGNYATQVIREFSREPFFRYSG
jgi:tRNA pseudouridine13 synthase